MDAGTPISHLFAGIPTGDYDRAMAWYERLLGRPPDILPMPGEAMWSATERASICLVTDPERAGQTVVTLAVPDLTGLLTRLAELGIEAGPVEHVGGPGSTRLRCRPREGESARRPRTET